MRSWHWYKRFQAALLAGQCSGSLLGKRVDITDTEFSYEPDVWVGTVIAERRNDCPHKQTDAVLVKLDVPVLVEGRECTHAVAQAKQFAGLRQSVLDLILPGDAVTCYIITVPRERAQASDPFASWWRGEGASMGCLVLRAGSADC